MSSRSNSGTPILLDVNVLIGVLDDESPFHEKALRWFKSISEIQPWATCPIVENGFIRIVSSNKYGGGRSSPEEEQIVLAALKSSSSSYTFWPDAISLCDPKLFNLELVQGSGQLTDLYLLGLCQKNKGRLATFDKRVSTLGLVKRSEDILHLV